MRGLSSGSHRIAARGRQSTKMMSRAQAVLLAAAVAIGAFGAGFLLSADDRLDPPEPIVVEGPEEPRPTNPGSTPPPTSGSSTPPVVEPEIVPPPTVVATVPPTPPPADDDGPGDDDDDDGGGGDD
jgi:hypothetical protein